MVFTTHFLDEADVLADHIVILSKGNTKCQGSGAELKNQFGGGYRVHIPLDKDVQGIDATKTINQDHAVYTTPDSKSAAKLIAELKASGHPDVQIAGPTVEDVFLRVAQGDIVSAPEAVSSVQDTDKEAGLQLLSNGQATTFFQQLKALMRKRLYILPRYWAAAFLALALPIACIPAINVFVADDFVRPTCNYQSSVALYTNFVSLSNYQDTYNYTSYANDVPSPLGPASANQTAFKVLSEEPIGKNYNSRYFNKDWKLLDGYDAFQKYVSDFRLNMSTGGLYMGDSSHPGTIVYVAQDVPYAMSMLNMYTSMRSGVGIQVIQQETHDIS